MLLTAEPWLRFMTTALGKSSEEYEVWPWFWAVYPTGKMLTGRLFAWNLLCDITIRPIILHNQVNKERESINLWKPQLQIKVHDKGYQKITKSIFHSCNEDLKINSQESGSTNRHPLDQTDYRNSEWVAYFLWYSKGSCSLQHMIRISSLIIHSWVICRRCSGTL